MGTWNYRVLRHRQPPATDEPDFLQIHEVYYSSDGKAESVSQDGARIGGDSIKEIRDVLAKIERALSEPIIDFESFR
jgi:hypothetical protein